MRRTAIALLFLIASAAHADPQEANFTGPLITSNASALPAGMAVIEPYLIYTETHANYDAQGNRHTDRPGTHQWLLLVPLTLGVTDRFNVQLVGGTAYNVSGQNHSDGSRLTDTSIQLQYMFVAPKADGTGPAVSASYTHVFPTGAYDRLADNPLNATGTGASVNQLSIYAQQKFWLDNGHPLRVRAQLAWSPSPSRIHVDGTSAHGTTSDFQGWAKPGPSYGARAAAEYSLDRHWVLAMDVTWDYQRHGMLQGSICSPEGFCQGFQQPKPTNWSWGIAPAVEYNVNDSLGFIAGAQVSVAGHQSASYVAPQIAMNVVF